MLNMVEIGITGFWERFDQARTDTLDVICNKIGMSHNTLRGLRTHGKLPNLADTVVIADYLNVSLDWLVLGKVMNEKGSELSEVLKAYSEADELTKLMVRRLLKLT